MMTPDNYRHTLEHLATAFRTGGAHVTMHGDGVGSFLVIALGPRGAELYQGDVNHWIVDPALDQILLGEVAFGSV